jgi:hypothetical protein
MAGLWNKSLSKAAFEHWCAEQLQEETLPGA